MAQALSKVRFLHQWNILGCLSASLHSGLTYVVLDASYVPLKRDIGTHRGAYGAEGGGGMYRSKMAGFSFFTGASTGLLGA